MTVEFTNDSLRAQFKVSRPDEVDINRINERLTRFWPYIPIEIGRTAVAILDREQAIARGDCYE